MSCNTFIPIMDLVREVEALLAANYIDKNDPRITEGVFTNPTIKDGFLLDVEARLEFCRLVQECGLDAPFGKMWLASPLSPGGMLISYEESGQPLVKWASIQTTMEQAGVLGAAPTSLASRLAAEIQRSKDADNQNNSDMEQALEYVALNSREIAAEVSRSTNKDRDTDLALQSLTQGDANLQGQISSIGGGNVPYLTYAAMVAAKADITNKMILEVMNDPDPLKNGKYSYDGVSEFTKSAYDSLAQSKSYTDVKTDKLNLFTYTDEYAWSISDKNGNVAIAVKDDGGFKAEQAEVSSMSIGETEIDALSEFAWAIVDKNGKAAIAVENDGSTQIASINAGSLKVGSKSIDEVIQTAFSNAEKSTKNVNFPANLIHFEIYGQSLSQGAFSQPIQTTVQKYDSLMFVGGIRPQHPSYTVPNFYADFIPLIESADVSGYVGYETPCGGATDAVKQLIKEENGIDFSKQQYQLLGSACGEGGMSITALSTTYLNNNLKPAITAAYNLAQAKGLTYTMPLMGWVQGEEDNKPANNVTIQQYKERMQTLINLVDGHLKTLDSNLKLGGMIAAQLCSFKTSGRTEPHIELAIYQAGIDPTSNIYLACPLYIFDYKDGYHVDGVSSKWMGAYIGLVHKRVVNDGESWLPVHPISHVKQGKILEVKFHVPVQPLVFDTTHIALNTNYGFTLVSSDNTPITISSVTMTQGDTVKIVAATAIPAGAKLRYAWTPSAAPNRTTGARGNLRDSQGDDIIFDPQGINKSMHNWTPIFEYGV